MIAFKSFLVSFFLMSKIETGLKLGPVKDPSPYIRKILGSETEDKVKIGQKGAEGINMK